MDGKLFLTAAALLLVAACTKEDPGAAFRSDPDAVRITAQVGDGLSGGFVSTRSNPVSEIPEEQAAFKAGDRISVTADGQKKVVYTLADDGSWNPEAGKYLKWTSRTMTFSACYPAADGVSTERFTVPADQSDADKIAAADYMTFSDPVTRGSNNGVTLAMTRKMVRIVLEPDIQNQFGEGYSISELKVHGNRRGYSGGNLVNGDVAVKAYKHTDGKFYALLPPTYGTGDLPFIDVTVTNGSDTRTLTAKGIPATEAGKSYTVSLTVGKNVASVTGVSVSEWVTSTAIASGGEAVLVPYITFTAEAEQTFKMDFDKFTLNEGDYFEYSVNGGKWVQFTSTVSDVAFGGTKGNLRLRGKSSKGTATNVFDHSTISFGNTTKVSCTGDIRTLIDYQNYADAPTANARFYSLFWGCKVLTTAPELPAKELASNCYGFMFYHCQALTEAPELPATTLAYMCYEEMYDSCIALTKAPTLPAENLTDCCYQNMFYNCINLSSVTIKATDVSAKKCLLNCLTNAGTAATSRTLTLASDEVYTAMVSKGYVPDLWKKADKYDNNGNEIGAEATTDIPYVTFSAASGQTFSMTFNSFTLGSGEYFEYSVGGDKWVRFTGTVSNVAFGGAKGNLRLRGKSSNGTATNNTTYCSKISFSDANVPVKCTGDIRTLINYADYSTDNTGTAKFCYLFSGCTQITSAPELPAKTLANYCYRYMFNGCTNLSSVTMLATDVGANDCLRSWLFDAGTGAISRTLTVASAVAYTAIESTLPDNWKKDVEGGATVIFIDSTSSTGE